MDVSIVIVTYNSASCIGECLDSIETLTCDVEYEVIVVDNGSTDATVDLVDGWARRHGNIRLLRAQNRGFNAGNNLGISIASGEYILLLNPDTVLLNNAVKILCDASRVTQRIGMAGARILTSAGFPNSSFGTFPSLRNTFKYSLHPRRSPVLRPSQLSRARVRVDFPVGAVFMFPAALWKELGPMDEGYFLFFDETDFAKAISMRGYRAYIFPEAKVIHLQGQSTGPVSSFAARHFEASNIRYLERNVGSTERFLMYLVEASYLRIRRALTVVMFPSKRVSAESLKTRLLYIKRVFIGK